MLLSAGLSAAQTATAKAPADPAKVRAEIEKAIEALRTDARAGKSDILGKTLKLDSAQAAAFWPVYKQYEAEAKVLGDERLGIIQDLAEHFDSLDDAKAKALLDRQMALEDKKVALHEEVQGRDAEGAAGEDGGTLLPGRQPPQQARRADCRLRDPAGLLAVGRGPCSGVRS